MSINKRLEDVINTLYSGNKRAFSHAIGVAASVVENVVGSRQGKPSYDVLEKICANAQINPEWLLMGEGAMLKTEEKAIYKVPEGSSSGIPLIPIDAMAGFGSDEMRIMEYECDRYVVPMFRDANYLIAVKGSSMQPKYNNGDLVACRVVPLDTFFQWNKVYVLDTEQGALIKRVKKGSDNNHITLVSENENYEPFELHLNKVNALAIVVGVLRLE